MATCILRPIRVIGVVVTTLVASSGVGTGAPANTVAGGCLSAPNSPAPAGEHWYYHIDRAKQRKCWYLRTQTARQTDAAPASEVVPARHSVFTKPPARSAGAPAQARADSAAIQPDGRSSKPQFAPKISGRTDEIAPEKSQPVSSARSIAGQESAGQSRIAAPPRPTPAVTAVQAEPPIAAPSDVRRGNAKAPDSTNAGSAGRKTGPTIISKIAKLPGTPNFLALVLALGLIAGVGGDLWRVAFKFVSAYRGQAHFSRAKSNETAKRRNSDGMKISARRSDTRINNKALHGQPKHDEWPASANEKQASFTNDSKVLKSDEALARVSQQIDQLLGMPSVDEDQCKQEWHEDQQQELTHPATASDEWQANGNEKHASFTSNGKVLKPDDALARLSQEMDWLLQKPRLA